MRRTQQEALDSLETVRSACKRFDRPLSCVAVHCAVCCTRRVEPASQPALVWSGRAASVCGKCDKSINKLKDLYVMVVRNETQAVQSIMVRA